MPSMKLSLILLAVLAWTSISQAQPRQTDAGFPNVPDLRTQARVVDAWTEYRLDTLVPELMRRHNIDMWVLVAREYNEDPVLLTMLPATWQSSRRTTILVFFDPGEDQPVERLAVARYNIGFFQDPVGCSHPTRPVGTFRGNRAGTKSTPYCCKHLLNPFPGRWYSPYRFYESAFFPAGPSCSNASSRQRTWHWAGWKHALHRK